MGKLPAVALPIKLFLILLSGLPGLWMILACWGSLMVCLYSMLFHVNVFNYIQNTSFWLAFEWKTCLSTANMDETDWCSTSCCLLCHCWIAKVIQWSWKHLLSSDGSAGKLPQINHKLKLFMVEEKLCHSPKLRLSKSQDILHQSCNMVWSWADRTPFSVQWTRLGRSI